MGRFEEKVYRFIPAAAGGEKGYVLQEMDGVFSEFGKKLNGWVDRRTKWIKERYDHFPVLAVVVEFYDLSSKKKGKNKIYRGHSFCSPEEVVVSEKEGLRTARQRAILKIKKELGWEVLIESGLVNGYIPKSEEEVEQKREKRKEDRRAYKLHMKRQKAVKMLWKLGLTSGDNMDYIRDALHEKNLENVKIDVDK